MEIKFIDRKTGQLKTEQPPAELFLKLLYDNPLGKTAILPIAKRKWITERYGKKMNQASSKKKIQPFVNQLNINMDESLKSIDEFGCFNDFFYRKLQPNARPIEPGVVSPGDGKLLAFESVKEVNRFFVKGSDFNLVRFLQNHELAKQYAQASLLILRLAPNDYHRFHFPLSGTPNASKKINGWYYSVSPYALAKNFARVFCENKREYCLLNTQEKGDVLIAAVGATMVGSIINTYQPNQMVTKGQEMGYFAFGGSTIVLLINHIKIDADILQNTKNKLETYVQMGEKIGE